MIFATTPSALPPGFAQRGDQIGLVLVGQGHEGVGRLQVFRLKQGLVVPSPWMISVLPVSVSLSRRQVSSSRSTTVTPLVDLFEEAGQVIGDPTAAGDEKYSASPV